jgi:hypothetical protein
MNLPTVDEMMEILERSKTESVKQLTPLEYFDHMVSCGTIDKDGNVMPNKGFVTEEDREKVKKVYLRLEARYILQQLDAYTRQFRARPSRPEPPPNQVIREGQDPRSGYNKEPRPYVNNLPERD